MLLTQPRLEWATVPVTRIEDLGDAVVGAGLEATQMSRGELTGGIAYAGDARVVFTSGLINGRVALTGPLSQAGVTLGIGLRLGPGTRHWLGEVETGNVGVYLAGDEHDSIYMPGSLYVTATLSADTLEELAAERDLVLDARVLGGTGIHPRKIAVEQTSALEGTFGRIHAGRPLRSDREVGTAVLDALIGHLARPPHGRNGGRRPDRHGQIIARARSYIVEHLEEPLSVDGIAAAAGASRRTLFRAFAEILDETPRSYVQRLRLHRIRRDLASEAERAATIAVIANEWGMSDLGRMAGSYRALFGEKPSETLARAQSLH
jgi:AraC-like DNA-binding protein